MILVTLYKDKNTLNPYQKFTISHFDIRYDDKTVKFLVTDAKNWEEYRYTDIRTYREDKVYFIDVFGMKI
jgi:hypothetical protein